MTKSKPWIGRIIIAFVTLRTHLKSDLKLYWGRRQRNLCLQVKLKSFNLKCPFLCNTETQRIKRSHSNLYCCEQNVFPVLKPFEEKKKGGGCGSGRKLFCSCDSYGAPCPKDRPEKSDTVHVFCLKIFLNFSKFKGINTGSLVIAHIHETTFLYCCW